MRLKILKSKTEIRFDLKFAKQKTDSRKIVQNQIKISQKCKYFINSRLCRPISVEENKITTELDGENSVIRFFLSVFLLNIKTSEQNY